MNIMTIFSICNIHDVSWGNRPTTTNEKFKRIENKKGIMYRNYRANFLILWALVNIAVAAGLVNASRRGNVFVIFLLGCFLVFIMIFKIILSTMHIFKSHYENRKVNKFIRSKQSHVFDDIATKETMSKEDIFTVYYDDEGNDFRISKDNIVIKRFLGNLISHSAVKSQNLFRGFNLAKLYEEQNQSNLKPNVVQGNKTLNFNNLATLKAKEDIKDVAQENKDTGLIGLAAILKGQQALPDESEEEEVAAVEEPAESPSPKLVRRKLGLGSHLGEYNKNIHLNEKGEETKLNMTKDPTVDSDRKSSKASGTISSVSIISDESGEGEESEYSEEGSEEEYSSKLSVIYHLLASK